MSGRIFANCHGHFTVLLHQLNVAWRIIWKIKRTDSQLKLGRYVKYDDRIVQATKQQTITFVHVDSNTVARI